MDNSNAPKDPYNIAYIIFYVLGTGSLLPWNFFIAVDKYWKYKFRNTTAIPDDEKGEELTELQIQWASYLSIASMIPNVLFLFLNALAGHKFKAQPRLLSALLIIIALFVFNDVMTKVNTDTWQYEFLGVTLFTVVIINIMVAIFQGGLSGLAGKFPPSYMGAVVQGQALGGIFAAATNVVMLACGPDAVMATFLDFLIAVVFLVAALIAFVILTKTEFYQYYANEPKNTEPDAEVEKDKEAEQLIDTGDEAHPQPPSFVKISFLGIVRRIWIWILAVFLCFLVTLAVFPAVAVLVQSTDKGNAWSDKYFIPVGCFLLYNIGDYVGRMFASLVKWPKATNFGGIFILLLSIVRLAFIPLFLFCNAAPKNRILTEVYFESDAAYLVFNAILAVTNGYIGSIALMFGPKMLERSEDQGRAASILVFFLVMGLAVGAAISSYILLLL